jgi:aminopeptidase N
MGYLRKDTGFWYNSNYNGYFRLVKSGKEEPMSTHSDHYNTNFAYSAAAYAKGAVFLAQLDYIVGHENLDKILLEYYREWRFKHPNPNDFIRVAEKVSGIELQWYKEYWIYTTKTIDYALGNVDVVDNKTTITLKRLGEMPMPIDVLVTYKDGSKEMHYVPMNLMYGAKPDEDKSIKSIVHEEWKWTHPEYQLPISKTVQDIKEIEIDPSMRMADINRVNNKIVVP